MKLSLWQPTPTLPIRHTPDFDQVLDSLFGSFSNPAGHELPWSPQTDASEDEQGYSLKMEVPGFNPESIEISFDGDTLSIEGTSSGIEEKEGVKYHRTERTSGSFRRTFHLPEAADADNATAEIGDGLLEIRIPKREAAKRRLLSIKRR